MRNLFRTILSLYAMFLLSCAISKLSHLIQEYKIENKSKSLWQMANKCIVKRVETRKGKTCI